MIISIGRAQPGIDTDLSPRGRGLFREITRDISSSALARGVPPRPRVADPFPRFRSFDSGLKAARPNGISCRAKQRREKSRGKRNSTRTDSDREFPLLLGSFASRRIAEGTALLGSKCFLIFVHCNRINNILSSY